MVYRTQRFRIVLGLLTWLRLVINTGARFVEFFLPAIARGLGVPLERAGDLISIRWAAGLATPALMSVMSRGRARRQLIMLGVVLFAAGAAITAATSVYIGAVVGFVLLGLAKPIYDVSAQAYLADRVPYARRGRYVGIFELTWASALLIGAPVTGWMIRSSGWYSPFWLLSVLAMAGGIVVWRLLDSDDGDTHGVKGRLRLDRPSTAFLVTSGLYSAASQVMFIVLGAWLEDSFGLSLVAAGGIAVFIALAELSGEAVMAALGDRFGKRRFIFVGVLIAAGGFALFAVANGSLVGGVAAVMVAYGGFELAIVSGIPYATEIHPHARARFLSWMVVGWAGGRTLGSMLGPRLYVGSGITTAALIASVLCLISVAVFWWGGVPRNAMDGQTVPDSGADQEN